MQKIVGMLVLGRTDLGAPISSLSPWLDMLIRTDEEVFGLLEAQRHRRFIKKHTPLDGLPRRPSVTYITVIRHPLDVAGITPALASSASGEEPPDEGPSDDPQTNPMRSSEDETAAPTPSPRRRSAPGTAPEHPARSAPVSPTPAS
jgi:hypothetical protein